MPFHLLFVSPPSFLIMSPELPTSSQVASELSDLRVSVRLWWTIGLAVFGCVNLFVLLLTVPKFAMFFDDMIPGGRAKLPVLTQMVLMWSRTAPICELVVLLVMAAGLVPLWRMKSVRFGTIVAALVMTLLAAQFVLTLVSLYLPLTVVYRGLLGSPD